MTRGLRIPGALALCIPTLLVAQRNCGAMEVLQQEIANDPQRLERLNAIEEHTHAFAAHFDTHGQRAVITIPTVVHVVWRTATEDVSDALINAQMAQLNADFAKLNSDANTIPSLFAGLAANTEIQFCLAQRDPNGNPTSGIVRRQTTVTSFSTNNAVKFSAQGGSDAWPAGSYLNLWVCNLSNGVLGYAQFPGGSASTDGVVVLFSSVGSLAVPGSGPPFDHGRTATHEVGHWLNLRHIWGDATCGSDLVSDTPTHNAPNEGCPVYPHPSTCSGNPVEMTMNYMDYTDDNCMTMFSAGQSTRMNAVLAPGGARNSITTSLGCTPPTPGTCGTPSGLAASGITTTGATLTWGAVSGATSYDLQYKTTTATTWINVNTTTTSRALTGLLAGTAYNAQVRANCSGGSSNFSSSITFTTASNTACTDTYESNETRTAGKVIPVNSTITARIGSSTDKDWFRFNNTTSTPRMRVELTNVPADYDLQLYRGSTLVATSQQSGTANETIINNTSTVTTYYVQVYGYNGAFNSTTCYNLRVSLSASNFREGQVDGEAVLEAVTGGIMNLFPNPSQGKVNIDYLSAGEDLLELTILDMSGRVVHTQRQTVPDGPSTFGVDVDGLGNGLYLLTVQQGGQLHQQRFQVSR